MSPYGTMAAALALLLALPPALADVPQSVRSALARGINVETWMQRADPKKYALTNAALVQIRHDGFLHVRLPVNPALFKDERTFKRLDDALARIQGAGLAVIVDLHPGNEWPNNASDITLARPALEQLARHLTHTDPNRVLLEIYNEPQDDPKSWNLKYRELELLARSILPQHTLVVGGGDWNSIAGLEALQPSSDTNIVYAMHFYQPMRFTHQGASWMGKTSYEKSPAINFPVRGSPALEALVAELRKAHADADANDLENDMRQGYGVDSARKDIQRAVDWARRHDRMVIMDEFGVYKKNAPMEDRILWLKTVREIAEQGHIGWTLWEHGSGFGLYNVVGESGWSSDKALLEALGSSATKDTGRP